MIRPVLELWGSGGLAPTNFEGTRTPYRLALNALAVVQAPTFFPIPSLDSAKRDSANFGNADGKSSAKCKFCVHANVIITERIGTTSNFIRHFERVHSQRYISGNLLLLLAYHMLCYVKCDSD